MNTRHTSFGLTLAVLVSMASAVIAQTPAPQGPAALALTAVSANVNGAGEKLEFFINKWSSDADRDRLVTAWSVTAAPAATAAPGAAGRGGDAAAPAAAAGGGRGGRGGRGVGNAPAAPRTPEAALTAAVKELPSVGYFWTSEVGGYLIHYAYQVPQPGGGSRIILLTDKRLGAAKNNWRTAAPATPNTYEFTLIELRLPAKGPGTGKASITGTIVVDPDTKSIGLEGYDALPVTLQDIKLRPNS
jgi:hypothetical protein